jgi:hypothetical protein
MGMLGGFRFLNLNETLGIRSTSFVLDPTAVPGTINGNLADQVLLYATNDRFRTQNRWYGGQIGCRMNYGMGRLGLGMTCKCGFGSTEQVALVSGASRLVAVDPTQSGVAEGGLLALPSNIGRHSRNEFAVVPEVGCTINIQATENVRVWFGYNFIYWSNVARPGDLVNRVVDTQQVPLHPNFNPAAQATQPPFQWKSSDYWAQGMNWGFEVAF